jgi:hypothetical protein
MKQRSEKKNKVAVLGIIAVIVGVMLLASMATATAKLYGDANGDGMIDENDMTYVEQIIAGEKAKTELADANQDGTIDFSSDIGINLFPHPIFFLEENFRRTK